MAKQYKEVKDKLEKTPLTQEELIIIDTVESYIDGIISKKFDGGSISIELPIVNFSYNISVTEQRNIPEFRRHLMQKELEKRYKKAGWKTSIRHADYREPMCGPDYWILTGMKNA